MWKTIEGYENYEINVFGEVKNKTTGKIKTLTLAKNGYYVVVLYKNNKGKMDYIHRLLAKAFIKNSHNLPTVNHKDGDKQNIKLENLEWASFAENNQHAYDTGLKKVTRQMMNHSKTLHKASVAKNPFGAYRNPIVSVNIVNGESRNFPNVKTAAEELGFHRSTIDRVLKGKRQSAKGFTFKYLEECDG